MTQVALPETVVGAFDGTTVVSDGLPYRVFQEADAFWAEMPDPDVMMYVVQGGKKLAFKNIPRVRQRVVMTTGSHHYQTYWVASPRYDRLLQTLPLVYLIRDQRWIPREAAFMRPPDDRGRFITQWNHHCIRCHSTAGNPGLNRDTGMLDTRVAELGIACEACHGPGGEHVRCNQDPLRRYQHHLGDQSDTTVVNPAKLDHRRSSQVCGQCHGVYIMRDEFAMKSATEGALYQPGQNLDRTRYYIQHPAKDPSPERWEDLRQNPDFFRERWWDDGTILAGGREYTALAVSGCYTRGEISCLSCHSMHESDPVDQLKPGMDGNLACTQCHTDSKYTKEVTRHTFHALDSPGSLCLNCHMPHTTYALLGAIRSHQIASPELTGSIRHGVPNACNLCHLDKTLAWSQEHLAERYGRPQQPLSEEQRTVSAALLWLLKGHAAQRAITAWHLGWKPAQQASGADWLAPFLARLLADPYGVVRYVAAYNLRSLPGFTDWHNDFLAPEPILKTRALEAVERWQAEKKLLHRPVPEMLIRPDGQLMEERIEALLRQRNDRPVTIKE
jgi:predicted CXXCH cytochrome family protein